MSPDCGRSIGTVDLIGVSEVPLRWAVRYAVGLMLMELAHIRTSPVGMEYARDRRNRDWTQFDVEPSPPQGQ